MTPKGHELIERVGNMRNDMNDMKKLYSHTKFLDFLKSEEF